eukprot:TRINITY_DN47614_c0_g2_i9.p1 TRINITY_DN47614_c0_g2~~TRINITY_DN47614_c0_g2_i9.p1  ORF type:complete len:315 (-),score=54.01 TRINITY_DN47614_c0_g2_i9:94-1038(-)
MNFSNNPVGQPSMEHLFFSEADAFARLCRVVENGQSESVHCFLTKSHSVFLRSLLFGQEGMNLFFVALSRSDLRTMKVLTDNGCCSSLFCEELELEHSGKSDKALELYHKHLMIVDEKMEQALTDAVIQSQVFLPALAGKYRVMARLALVSNHVESFLELVDQAWKLHVPGHKQKCERLFWNKQIVIHEMRKNVEESESECFLFMSSPLYLSFGLHELGLYEEAYCCLKNALLETKEVLSLAQGSRCLMSLRSVSTEARAVYRRLQVFASDEYFESQQLYVPEVRLVKQVMNRVIAFICHHPFPEKRMVESHQN